MIKRIKYKGIGQPGRPVESMTVAGIGRTLTSDYNTEILEGVVQEKKASAGEERFARGLEAYREKVKGYEFRMALGARRNMPGWLELDFLVETHTFYYAVEIDSVFTHRMKQNADVLHDAIVLKELNYLSLYPKVIHIDGEKDLADPEMTKKTIRNLF